MNHDGAWRPGADWAPVTDAEGAATVGVWRVRDAGTTWIVKRLRRDPSPSDPRAYRWWRREIEVASSQITAEFRGLIAPHYRVEDDAEGSTLWSRQVPHDPPAPVTVAQALGRFASVRIADPGWFSAGRLRDRITATAPDGLACLESALDAETLHLTHEIWNRRETVLSLLDELPQVLSHGDALPRNLLRSDGATMTAIDWDQIGYNTVGADLATYSLWAPSPSTLLLKAYHEALDTGVASEYDVKMGFALTTALIAVMRFVRSEGSHDYLDRLIRARPQLSLTLHAIA